MMGFICMQTPGLRASPHYPLPQTLQTRHRSMLSAPCPRELLRHGVKEASGRTYHVHIQVLQKPPDGRLCQGPRALIKAKPEKKPTRKQNLLCSASSWVIPSQANTLNASTWCVLPPRANAVLATDYQSRCIRLSSLHRRVLGLPVLRLLRPVRPPNQASEASVRSTRGCRP